MKLFLIVSIIFASPMALADKSFSCYWAEVNDVNYGAVAETVVSGNINDKQQVTDQSEDYNEIVRGEAKTIPLVKEARLTNEHFKLVIAELGKDPIVSTIDATVQRNDKQMFSGRVREKLPAGKPFYFPVICTIK